MLRAAVRGQFPPDDGAVSVVPPWRDGVEAVVSFTAHAVVATTLPGIRLDAAGIDAYSGAFAPAVILELAGPDGVVDSLDLVLGATGTGRTGLPERPDLAGHPRVRHAAAWRTGVHVHADSRGLITVSRGLGGLAELSFEVPPDRAGAGTGAPCSPTAEGWSRSGNPCWPWLLPGTPGHCGPRWRPDSCRSVPSSWCVPAGFGREPGSLAAAAPAAATPAASRRGRWGTDGRPAGGPARHRDGGQQPHGVLVPGGAGSGIVDPGHRAGHLEGGAAGTAADVVRGHGSLLMVGPGTPRDWVHDAGSGRMRR